MRHKVAKFWASAESRLAVCPKRKFFGKIDCYFCVHIVPHARLNKILRVNHEMYGGIILSQIGHNCQNPKGGIFGGSSIQIFLV